jgi:ABC-2 type transport system permease protein
MTLRVERTLAAVTARQILARRRALAMAAFGLLPVAVAALSSGGDGPDEALQATLQVLVNLVVPVVLPVVALVVGTGVFGAEIEDGTALFVLAKPVARWRIVLTRVLVAGTAAAVLTAPAAFLVSLAAGGSPAARTVGAAFAAAVAVGALVYAALFVALSLATRRALVAGLVYVVLWEGTMAPRAAGLRPFSVRQLVLSIADRLSDTPPALFQAQLGPRAAMVMCVVLGAGATAYAVRRLRQFEVGEAA